MAKNSMAIVLAVLVLGSIVVAGSYFYLQAQEETPDSTVTAQPEPAVAPTAANAEAVPEKSQPNDEAAPAAATNEPAGREEMPTAKLAETSASEPDSTAPSTAESKAAVATESPLTGFETLATPQPTLNPDKIEVIEFFWYGCPHCYAFEPLLENWVKKLPANVDFIRQPAAFSELWGKHAKAFYVAQALGVLDKLHADFFDTIQNKQQKLDDEAQLASFFTAHGVKEADFHDAFNSFLVDSKLRQAEVLPARYGVTGVPILIVNGKYKVDGKSAGSHEKMLEVASRLIQRESAEKK